METKAYIKNGEARTKLLYHWAKTHLGEEDQRFLTKVLPKVERGKMVRNAIVIWETYVAQKPARAHLRPQLERIVAEWGKADIAAVHKSHRAEQLAKPETQERIKKKQASSLGIPFRQILDPGHLGINPMETKDITPEIESNNKTWLTFAEMRRNHSPTRYLSWRWGSSWRSWPPKRTSS